MISSNIHHQLRYDGTSSCLFKFAILVLLVIEMITSASADATAPPPGRVDVQIYDHRAYHDPSSTFGKGPWHFFSHGYGLNYQYEPDQSYQRERGYQFEQGFMRDLCDGKSRPCTPSKPSIPSRRSFPAPSSYPGYSYSDSGENESTEKVMAIPSAQFDEGNYES
jgi:hypothetical protein